ncbi:hypothetical protein KKF91_00900, partial [Myxococcota bacterium]|nr:hypothetical protein [Myxococcota bacterium]
MNPIDARARIEARLGRGVCGAGLAMGLCLGVAEAAPTTAPADVSAMDASTPTQDQGVDDLGEAVALYEAPMTCQAALSGADND